MVIDNIKDDHEDCPKGAGVYGVTFQDRQHPDIKFSKSVIIKQQKVDGVTIPHNADDACGKAIRKVMAEESITDILEFHDKFKVLSIFLESSRE